MSASTSSINGTSNATPSTEDLPTYEELAKIFETLQEELGKTTNTQNDLDKIIEKIKQLLQDLEDVVVPEKEEEKLEKLKSNANLLAQQADLIKQLLSAKLNNTVLAEFIGKILDCTDSDVFASQAALIGLLLSLTFISDSDKETFIGKAIDTPNKDSLEKQIEFITRLLGLSNLTNTEKTHFIKTILENPSYDLSHVINLNTTRIETEESKLKNNIVELTIAAKFLQAKNQYREFEIENIAYKKLEKQENFNPQLKNLRDENFLSPEDKRLEAIQKEALRQENINQEKYQSE